MFGHGHSYINRDGNKLKLTGNGGCCNASAKFGVDMVSGRGYTFMAVSL